MGVVLWALRSRAFALPKNGFGGIERRKQGGALGVAEDTKKASETEISDAFYGLRMQGCGVPTSSITWKRRVAT